MKSKIGFWLIVGVVAFALVDSAGGFAQNSVPEKETISKKPELTESLFTRGHALYQKQCAVCHGTAGAGDGKAAYLLSPKPRDLTRNEFRLISTAKMEATDEDLFKVLTRGMPGSAMPPWKGLSEEDRWSLVYYVRYLANLGKKQKSGELTPAQVQAGVPWGTQKSLATETIDPASVIRPPQEMPANAESVAVGKDLFSKFCAACHGPSGKGDVPITLTDTLGYPLRPRDLSSGIFKGNADYEGLYYRISAGLPGSPMPAFKSALEPEQIQKIIHYLRTLSGEQKPDRGHIEGKRIIAVKTQSPFSAEPLSSDWASANPVSVSLMPLWWRDQRIEDVEVRVLFHQDRLAVRLSWKDASRNDSTLAPQSFSDGAAVQFSFEKDPPFFGMGAPGSPVSIWHWKASWQKDTENREDVETHYPGLAVDPYMMQTNYKSGEPLDPKEFKTQFHDPSYLTGYAAGNPLSDPGRKKAGEEVVAEGLGTTTSNSSGGKLTETRGVYENGVWHVVFDGKLENIKAEAPLSLALAVWDGEEKDRNGQKMVSIWNELVFES